MHPEFGCDEFSQASGVSRETLTCLSSFVDFLREWNALHNLVSKASFADVWWRHVWDSAQLSAYIPLHANTLVDLGSGAGFPGLVLAALRRQQAGFRTVLYEATRKKCEFLREAGARMGVDIEVRCKRIEEAPPEIFDVVTSRACAPLNKLLGYASRFQGPRTVNLFLKGQAVGQELTEASKYWDMQLAQHSSCTDGLGRILEIRGLARAR